MLISSGVWVAKHDDNKASQQTFPIHGCCGTARLGRHVTCEKKYEKLPIVMNTGSVTR